MNKKLIITLVPTLFIASSYQIQAADWTDKVRINGFANAVYQVTDEPVAIHGAAGEGGIDDRGNFTGTSFGFDITAEINDRITLYSQLSASHEDSYVCGLGFYWY